jgi:hypothetical protein
MLETIASVVFVVLALGTLLLKGWALNGWPRAAADESETDDDACGGESERSR